MKSLPIIVITGYSGSGKSTALAAFEDAGFYCVDNLPVALLPKFLELPLESESELCGLAFVMDMRDRRFPAAYGPSFDSLRAKGYILQILFLEAEESVLVQRYSETRRHHPLAKGKSLVHGIREEARQLASLKGTADRVIDTSDYSVHTLKSAVLEIAEKYRKQSGLQIHVQSFGFKHGVPPEADLVMDVRFMDNPHFVEELRPLDGENERVRAFVLERKETRIFLGKYLDLLDYLIPLYEKEGKSYLTIAIGCTGGRHRSVAVARTVYEHIDNPNRRIDISHRDIRL